MIPAMIPKSKSKSLALAMLVELDMQHKRATYRSLPDHAIPPSRFEDRTANGLTRCILRYLELKGHWATRINTTGRLLQGKQYTDVLGHRKQHNSTWIPGATKRGTADIHSVIHGRHVSFEIKVGRDRMSEHQQRTKESIEASGGTYIEVRTFDEFYKWYNNFNNKNLKQ
jgi:hypothetical protein